MATGTTTADGVARSSVINPAGLNAFMAPSRARVPSGKIQAA